MIVTFYTFMKKSRSTARPSEGGVAIDCYLKDGTSRHEPVFVLEWNEMPTWNMCTAFDNAYYWISDVVAVHNGLYEIICTLDLLATHRNSIENSTQFVSYCRSGTTSITDNRNPVKCTVRENVTLMGEVVSKFQSEGCFILTVASSAPTRGGGMTASYAVDALNMAQLAQQMFDVSIAEELRRFFGNPFDAIISCQWMPLGVGTLGSGSIPIYLGGQLMNASGSRISNFFVNVGSQRVTIPYGDDVRGYLRYHPYTTILLYLPFVGIVEVDPQLCTEGTFVISCTASAVSGDVVYEIYSNSSAMIATYSGNCAMNVPIAQRSTDVMSSIVGTVQSLAGYGMILSGNPLGVGMAVGGLTQAVNGASVHTQVNGALRGGVGASNLIARMTMLYNEPATAAITAIANHAGLPLFKTVPINTLSGYIQTVGADMESVAELGEIRDVCAIMDGGFWYE